MEKQKQLFIVANWKCNPASWAQARRLFDAVEQKASARNTRVVVATPFVYLALGKERLRRAALAAENVFWENAGAYTGEVGPRMVRQAGASYVVIGHSERREYFGETNETVQKKVQATLKEGLSIILCVGEKSRADDAARYTAFIREQVQQGLEGVPKTMMRRVVIAYEPLWAVGSGVSDTPASTLEMAIFIRRIIFGMYGKKIAQEFSVLYGGSASAANAESFLRDGGVDGLLVGRASLDAKEFGKILEIANHAFKKDTRF